MRRPRRTDPNWYADEYAEAQRDADAQDEDKMTLAEVRYEKWLRRNEE